MSFPKKIIIGIFGLCVSVIAAQAQYRFDSWTTDNGLPQNSVRRILQTSDGYLWFTTLDGLVRFDGVKFTVFNKSNSKNLPTNRFINLFAEADDTLWICTEEQGVVRYRNGEFRTFTTADGLPSDLVLEIAEDADGNLSALTQDGAARFDGNRFAVVSSGDEVRGFKQFSAHSGTIWRIDANSLTAVKNERKTIFELPANLKQGFEPNFNFFLAVNLFEDRQGDLWFTVNNRKSNYLDGKLFKFSNGKFEEIAAEGMPPSLVFNIEQDRRGNLWFATQADGACRLSENRFICFTPENGLPSRRARHIFKDREETLWITTEDRGIYRLTEQAISPLSTKQGLAEKNTYTIFEDKKGAVWIGSYGGLAKFADGKVTNYRHADGLLYTDVQSLFEDANGRLWIGSLNGIEYFENGKFYDFTENLSIPKEKVSFFDIHRDRAGNLWFATNVGLIKYDGETAKRLTTADGLPGNSVKTIVENDDGSFWIGTYDGIALFKDGKFTVYAEKDGLAGNHVRAIYKDETDALWIGTYDSGLSRFKDGKFTVYTKENGLSSNGVFQILEDAGKNFWMSCNQGIYRVSRAELEEFADGKRRFVTSTLFGKTDGLLSSEANGGGQPAGIKTADGKLWFPTQDGAAVINPEAVSINLLPPPVVIEDARIDNQTIDNLPKDIEIQPGQENLEIDYTGLSFIKPEQIRFRYRLKGLDENWTEAGNRRTAFYPHLAPGEYTFQVVAANSDNVWNETGASVKISVKPAFYQTWWFVILCVLAAAAVIFWIYQKRLSAEKQKHAAQEEFSRRLIDAHESERRRVAAELHDSLGQTLAMIKNRAVFAVQNTKDLEKAKEEFDQITEQSVFAINEVREISYNLRPYLLDRLGLTKALKSLFNKTAENSQLKITAEIENIDKIFTSEEEMSIYRVVQESLSNILKHAEAENVKISIAKTENFVTLKIQDDGKGFSTDGNLNDNKKTGFGLLGMAERIKILGGTHLIESGSGKGTTVKIKIDISKRTAIEK